MEEERGDTVRVGRRYTKCIHFIIKKKEEGGVSHQEDRREQLTWIAKQTMLPGLSHFIRRTHTSSDDTFGWTATSGLAILLRRAGSSVGQSPLSVSTAP